MLRRKQPAKNAPPSDDLMERPLIS